MKSHPFFKLLLICTVLGVTTDVFGQCKNFTKKTCIPFLSPYIHNGQMNSTMLKSGEVADLQMTFYSGQDYRIVVCGQAPLDGVGFKVLDKKRKVVYDSKEAKSNSWDFNVASTQPLVISIDTPKQAKEEAACVSVLIGFKQ